MATKQDLITRYETVSGNVELLPAFRRMKYKNELKLIIQAIEYDLYDLNYNWVEGSEIFIRCDKNISIMEDLLLLIDKVCEQDVTSFDI